MLADFLLSHAIVSLDEVHQVAIVLTKLSLTLLQCAVSSLELDLQLFYLFIDSIAGKLSKEHLFFLIDELIDVLSSLLFGELYTGASNMHGLIDSSAALFTVT